MKVTNHQNGNYHYCGSDSAVMYGSIEMSVQEWEAVRRWLAVRYAHAVENNETYQRDSLSHVVTWSIPHAEKAIQKGECFSIGVEATRLMFGAFGLQRYKKQNYSITVK